SFLFALLSSSSFGQPTPMGHEKVYAMKVAFMTQAIDLTPQESEKFWPLYNEYWSKMRQGAHAKRDIMKQIEQGSATAAQLSSYFDCTDRETALMRNYAARFEQIMPITKVAKAFVAEANFKNYLMREAFKSVK
ncbi:MAG: hypothetical protein RR931_06690, partial [Mucinivorans sp.]